MHRPVTVLALLLVAAGAAAATQHIDGQRSTAIEDSQCWDCHAPGLWKPPMREVGLGLRVTGGEPADLEVQVNNTWRHDVKDLRALASLPPGGHWAFVVDAEPKNTTVSGVTPHHPLSDSETWARFDVPNGTQRVSLSLQTQAVFEHDISATLYGPDRVLELDVLDTAGGVVLGVETVADVGWGTYHAKVVRTAQPGEAPEEVPFELRIQTDPRPGRAMLVGTDATLDEGEAAILAWPLHAEAGAPAGDASITVFYTSYNHHEAASDPDMWHMRTDLDAYVSESDGRIVLGQQSSPPEDEEASASGALALLGAIAAVGSVLARRRPAARKSAHRPRPKS